MRHLRVRADQLFGRGVGVGVRRGRRGPGAGPIGLTFLGGSGEASVRRARLDDAETLAEGEQALASPLRSVLLGPSRPWMIVTWQASMLRMPRHPEGLQVVHPAARPSAVPIS